MSCVVVVVTQGDVVGGVVLALVQSEAEECLGGAHQRVVRGALGDLLATNTVLLVSER